VNTRLDRELKRRAEHGHRPVLRVAASSSAIRVDRRSASSCIAVMGSDGVGWYQVFRDPAPGTRMWPKHAAVTTRSANSSTSPQGK
jgi:hypothetical protein